MRDGITFTSQRQSARDANCLNLVVGVSQTSGIDDIHGHAVDLNRLAYCSTRGAGNFSDDGEVFSGQLVEERRFSYVGLTCEHNLKSAAKDAALTSSSKRTANLFPQMPQAPP